jgi:hypothetical protein
MVFEPLDSSGDGVTDTWGADYNGDGTLDTYMVDSNNNGVGDIYGYDYNQNGYEERVAVDANENGYAEFVSVDANEDGVYESTFVDLNENGVDDRQESPVAATGPTMSPVVWASGNSGMSFGPGAEIVSDANSHAVNTALTPDGYDYVPKDEY